ncbi:MAG TPA: inositol monophosphatase [Candidatus Saccharimonadales bacterium]|nr:inositol monophosphatase [Candidatus Saccharimonadales bacterium]
MDERLEFAQDLAREAGKLILQYFDGDQQVQYKADKSPVTIADKLINDHVIKRITATYPDHGVIGEEASTDRHDQQFVWFCDPIDGTKAFTWGLPTAVFSLALTTKGRPVLGVVYDPFLDYMYTAAVGKGSFLNGKRLRVNHDNLKTGLVGGTGNQDNLFDSWHERMHRQGIHLAFFSGYVYKCCLVARGRMVGVIEELVGNHDIASAELIITEAGGKVTDFAGKQLDYSKPFKGAVVSNGVVHDELLKIAQSG